MSIATDVTKVDSLFSNDTLQRVLKTVIEVGAAMAALYTTVIPNPPSLPASGAVVGGSGVLALVWNLLLKYATNVKSAKLDELAKAIDTAVDARLAAQSYAVKAPQAQVSTSPTVVTPVVVPTSVSVTDPLAGNTPAAP